MATPRLGRIGVRFGFRSDVFRDFGVAASVEAAQEIEDLGFGALWLNADRVLERGDAIAAATQRLTIASSIASIWVYEPAALAAQLAQLRSDHPGRFLLGVGVSHKPLVEATVPGRIYKRPLAAMSSWLDALDTCPDAVPVEERIVAALASGMLEMARDRSAGSHPYLVPVDQTREARKALGPGKVLATAVAVHVGADPDRARAIGREHLGNPYLGLPNYRRNWLRHGFDENDLAGGGSDHLVDALVAWGDAGTVAGKVWEHLDAGADHVALHILAEDPAAFPREALYKLAAALEPELES